MVGTISRLKPHLGLLPVLLIFVLVTGFTSLRAPLDTGPDEAVHFMFARFLKQEGYLPFTDEDRTAAGYKSDQPPLNALAVAAAYFWDDLNGPPYAKLTHDVHRRYLADNPDNFAAWRVLNTEDPIAGEFLFWYLGRWLSITFSTITLIVIYFIAWAVFENAPKRQLWSLSVVISVAFIPTFILISSVFSYENLLGLWLSLYLLVAVYIVKKGGPAWLYFLEGLFIGLGMATKLSVLLAPVNLLIVVLFIGYRQRWLWRVWLTRLGLSLAGVLLGAGWWFALVISKFNRVEELGWLAGLIYPVLAGDGSDPTARQVITAFAGQEESGPVTWPDLSALLDWLRALFNTFWSLRLSIPVNIRPILVVVIIMIVVGLAWNWWRRRETRLWLTFFLFNISLFCILPLIRLVVTGPQTAKGHHIFFPAAGAFAILMVYGLGAWLPRRWETQWLGGMLLGLGLLSWSIVQSVQIYQTPLPVWTFPAAIPSSAKPIELDFGGIVLKGYELKGVGDAPLCCPAGDLALHLNLYWLTEEYLDQDYLTEVRLLDQQGKMQSIWLGHPADGRLPARAWEPGDYVRAEIWLPLAGLEAGPYSVKIRLLGRQGPLSVAGEEGYTLTNINLSDPVSLPNLPTTGETAIVDIWQHDTLYSYDLGGSTNYAMPVFPRRSTIQMSTRQAMRLELIGPDQVVRSPELAEGQRNVFVIDPRWPEGEYRLLAQPEDSPSFETEPVLFVDSQGRNTRPPDSQVKVDANFAGQLKLLGYNLPQRQFMPGEAIPVTLHFQAVQEMPADFLMFNRLRDASGNVWGGDDRRPHGLYSTLFWAADEVVEDGFTIPIDPGVPAGLYYIDIGFYLPVGEAAVSLPLVQDGRMQDMTSVTIGPIEIGNTYASKFTIDSPRPQHRLDQPFGGDPNLILLGYDLLDQTGQDPKSLTLTLYWQPVSSLAVDYTTFVHVRNLGGDIVAQQDQPPFNGAYPTSLWDPGEVFADEIVVPLPADLPAASYKVVIGLYNVQTGERLAVAGHPANEVEILNIE